MPFSMMEKDRSGVQVPQVCRVAFKSGILHTFHNLAITGHHRFIAGVGWMALCFSIAAQAQTGTPSTNLPAASSGPRGRGLRGMADSTNVVKLSTIHTQDVCILPDQV